MPRGPVTFEEVYAEQMSCLGKGVALFVPAPYEKDGVLTSIELADVGYMDSGMFHRIFNATDPPSRLTPEGHVPYPQHLVHDCVIRETKQKSFYSTSVKVNTAGLEISMQTNASPGTGLSFGIECCRSSGAALIIPGRILPGMKSFKLLHYEIYAAYCLHNCENWLKLARQYASRPVDLKDLMFVTCIHKVSDWHLFAFRQKFDRREFRIAIEGPAVALGLDVGTTRIEHQGLQTNWDPSSMPSALSTPERDQCVFIESFRIHKIDLLWRRLGRLLRTRANTDIIQSVLAEIGRTGARETSLGQSGGDAVMERGASDADEDQEQTDSSNEDRPSHSLRGARNPSSGNMDAMEDHKRNHDGGAVGAGGNSSGASGGQAYSGGGGANGGSPGNTVSEPQRGSANGYTTNRSANGLPDEDVSIGVFDGWSEENSDEPLDALSEDLYGMLGESDYDPLDEEFLDPHGALLDYILEACPTAQYSCPYPRTQYLGNWLAFPQVLRQLKPEVHLSPSGLASIVRHSYDEVYSPPSPHAAVPELPSLNADPETPKSSWLGTSDDSAHAPQESSTHTHLFSEVECSLTYDDDSARSLPLPAALEATPVDSLIETLVIVETVNNVTLPACDCSDTEPRSRGDVCPIPPPRSPSPVQSPVPTSEADVAVDAAVDAASIIDENRESEFRRDSTAGVPWIPEQSVTTDTKIPTSLDMGSKDGGWHDDFATASSEGGTPVILTEPPSVDQPEALSTTDERVDTRQRFAPPIHLTEDFEEGSASGQKSSIGSNTNITEGEGSLLRRLEEGYQSSQERRHGQTTPWKHFSHLKVLLELQGLLFQSSVIAHLRLLEEFLWSSSSRTTGSPISELRDNSPSPTPTLISPPLGVAEIGASKQNDSVDSRPPFPSRRPTHRPHHSIDSSVLLPRVPFPRSLSGDPNVTSLGSTPDISQFSFPESSDDRPHQPRGRSKSDIEGASARGRPRPESYDHLGAKPGPSRFESTVDLGVAITSEISSDGSGVPKTLIIKEEGSPPTQYQLGNCIGRGQFGSVYRALNLNTGKMVAVKRIRLEGLEEEEISQLMKEIDLLKSLSHPSIVKYEGMTRDEGVLSLVLELAENGSLGQTLKAFGKLNERLVASYVVKILEGLHYLHSNDIIHHDLKAANILTTKNGNIKLSDFGVSLNMRAMECEMKDVAGTPNWMAPEVIELKGASTKSDIWSLACTVIELLSGRPPYGDITNSMTVMFRIVEEEMPPLPEGCSDLLQDFLTICFNKEPSKRPSAEELCEHEWLKKNWVGGKELRPQDSIPFLRRVSADVQKSEAAHRYLTGIDIPSTPSPVIDNLFFRSDEMFVSGTPPQRRMSNSPSTPRGQDAESPGPREHSFVKTTFSKGLYLPSNISSRD
ncbi:hypothetical protein JAAARDRAFT_190455 [Jaapia argillacea MUCL 33604]|uniref:Protein kinase domain-containing protein n=1 Tax=Jaapia argillacea MUCL 33604 TaxID=933084 RepID=A0A067Q6C7_9AGAM|nr:hypothetical protein JAAARDRAFT_190455 [Jaapia argillacea MUCL 33604]